MPKTGSGGLVAEPDPWADHVATYLDALERGDRSTALTLVDRLAEEGHDLVTLMNHLLGPSQRRVGELWVTNAWSVAQEHAATAISESVISALAVRRELELGHPDRRRGDRPGEELVVVACVEQEFHALPALMVAEHLRADSLQVSYLGANSSVAALVGHVHDLAPRAVLLSCSLSAFLPLVRRHVVAIRQTGTPVVVGGSAFDTEGRRASTLGATDFARTGAEVSQVVRRLPAAVSPAAPLMHPGVEEAMALFRHRETYADEVRSLVLSEVAALAADAESSHWRGTLEDQLPLVVGAVAASVLCGDARIYADALVWSEEVLAHRRAPAAVAESLHRALRRVLPQVLHRHLPAESA